MMEVANCTCYVGCPCQFNSPSACGEKCRALRALHIPPGRKHSVAQKAVGTMKAVGKIYL